MGDAGSIALKHAVQIRLKKVAQELQISEASVARAERHLGHLIDVPSTCDGLDDIAKSVGSRIELLIQAEQRSQQHIGSQLPLTLTNV